MKFTVEACTTISALSEGIFWDFKKHQISSDMLGYFGFDPSIIPEVKPIFSHHGSLERSVASDLSLTPGIPVSYKAGDQLNNAFALNVLNPGEVAATAGTSGVIYGVSDQLNCDHLSRINSFAHVNHEQQLVRIGVLLCINGAGIFNRWIRNCLGGQQSYEALNAAASKIPAGAEGLCMLPFGNGPERMLNNRMVDAHIHNLDLNLHSTGHLVRAGQESIAFAFRYGLDIMRENGMDPVIIRAGRANLFLSDVFTSSFVNATGVPVELYLTDGSMGAALGAGVGIGYYQNAASPFLNNAPLTQVLPKETQQFEDLYQGWKKLLEAQMQNTQ
jgi:xylulokinase